MITISIVTVGTLKRPVDFGIIEKWSSGIFRASHRSAVAQLPNSEGQDWEYTDAQLSVALRADSSFDITLGVTEVPLEDNYYLRRIQENVAVLSLYEMADIVESQNFSVEQYILRNCYEIAALFASNKGLLPNSYRDLVHDEVRRCLFDMNANKSDIVFSLNQPIICGSCCDRLAREQLPNGFVALMSKELKRLKRPLYVRIGGWVKQHPLWFFAITTFFALAINVASNLLYDVGKAVIGVGAGFG